MATGVGRGAIPSTIDAGAGVTDPSDDAASGPGAMGPEDDPMSGLSPALEEQAPDDHTDAAAAFAPIDGAMRALDDLDLSVSHPSSLLDIDD
jgi:hypothetical protein